MEYIKKSYEFLKEKNIFYLIVGMIFHIFSITRLNMAISIYIWPFCFLRYLHNNEKKIIPLLIASSCLIIVNILKSIGNSNSDLWFDICSSLFLSVVNILPFLIDDLLYDKIPKWKNVLIFPLSEAFIEFIFSLFPLANFNVYAYSLRQHTQFLQIISLFGCYFLSFIIALFASILDYSINLHKDERRISKFVYIYIIIILIIYFFGVVRELIPLKEGTINIASSIGVSQPLYAHGDPDLGVRDLDTYIDYIDRTMKRARDSDAKIMTYAEEAFFITIDDKEELLERVSELANNYSLIVLLPLDVYHNETYMVNEAILITDEKGVVYDYQKQFLIPHIESDYTTDFHDIKIISTKYGKMTVVICYDINFPYFINKLSREHFDILLMPSWDWDSVAEWHSNEVKFRAIEGGFNIIKNTCNGIVISTDARGRTLSYFIGKDYEDYNVISTVNNNGVKTLYSYIGIFFNYLYLAAIVIILVYDIIIEFFKNKRNKRTKSSSEVNMLTEMS